MFAEDLQGDIYNGSPGVARLFLFSQRQAPDRKPAFALEAQAPDGQDAAATGFCFWNISAATPSTRGFKASRIKKLAEI